MDNDNLPKYPAILKYQHKNQEQLIQTLFRAETLLDLILEQDLATYHISKLHDLLLILSELLQKARQLSEALPDVSAFLEEAPD